MTEQELIKECLYNIQLIEDIEKIEKHLKKELYENSYFHLLLDCMSFKDKTHRQIINNLKSITNSTL